MGKAITTSLEDLEGQENQAQKAFIDPQHKEEQKNDEGDQFQKQMRERC
jgi:hypothetical protein